MACRPSGAIPSRRFWVLLPHKSTDRCRTGNVLPYVASQTPLPSQSRVRSTALPRGEPKTRHPAEVSREALCYPAAAFCVIVCVKTAVRAAPTLRRPCAAGAFHRFHRGTAQSTSVSRKLVGGPDSFFVFPSCFSFLLLVLVSIFLLLGVQPCHFRGAGLLPHRCSVAPTLYQSCAHICAALHPPCSNLHPLPPSGRYEAAQERPRFAQGLHKDIPPQRKTAAAQATTVLGESFAYFRLCSTRPRMAMPSRMRSSLMVE